MTGLMIFHILICAALISLVLIQKGQASMSMLGAGGSHSLFGAKGSTKFLIKVTIVIAVMFFASSMFISIQLKPAKQVQAPSKKTLHADDPIAPPADLIKKHSSKSVSKGEK
jgi:preprotein translocase subunit SecG